MRLKKYFSNHGYLFSESTYVRINHIKFKNSIIIIDNFEDKYNTKIN